MHGAHGLKVWGLSRKLPGQYWKQTKSGSLKNLDFRHDLKGETLQAPTTTPVDSLQAVFPSKCYLKCYKLITGKYYKSFYYYCYRLEHTKYCSLLWCLSGFWNFCRCSKDYPEKSVNLSPEFSHLFLKNIDKTIMNKYFTH